MIKAGSRIFFICLITLVGVLSACSNSEHANDIFFADEEEEKGERGEGAKLKCFDNFRLPKLYLNSCKDVFFITDSVTGLPPSGFFQKPFMVIIPENKQMKCEMGGFAPTNKSPTLKIIKIDSSTTIRCAEFFNDSSLSAEMIRTYIFEESPTIPAIFITTNPNSLFDPDTGIYMDGANAEKKEPHYGANYWLDKEIPVFVEFTEVGGVVPSFAKYAGLEIFGNYSRVHPKKSVSISFRKQYGDNRLNYILFPDFPNLNSFKSFILRNNGNNFTRDYIRDRLASSISEGLDVDYQRGRFVVVYYNGQYFGIHDMRERSTEYYFETHYGLNHKKINLLKADNSVSSGSSDDYISLIEWVKEHDLSQEENYTYITSQIDVYNFMSYMQVEIFAYNYDWPGSNLKKWNCSEPKTPWRWFLYDLDLSFGNEKSDLPSNVFEYVLSETGNIQQNDPTHTFLLKSLLKNQNFKNAFINRMAALLRMNFSSNHIQAQIENLMKQIISEIPRDQARWSLDSDQMNKQLSKIKKFAEKRPAIMLENLQTFFGLGEVSSMTFSVYGQGTILIHDLPLNDLPITVNFFEKTPITVTAKAQNGCSWSHWSDGEKKATRVIYPQKSKELTAIFK